MSTTDAQRRGIQKTVLHLVVLMAVVLVLFFWKLNREAVVKPTEPPAGLVLLETPRALDRVNVGQGWRVALMDRPDCEPNQCHPARSVLDRLWGSATKLPRDLVDLQWYSPVAIDQPGPFSVHTVGVEFTGDDAAGWFVENQWQRYSQSVLIINPDNQLVAWVRPPFNAPQLVRSMALAGIL